MIKEIRKICFVYFLYFCSLSPWFPTNGSKINVNQYIFLRMSREINRRLNQQLLNILLDSCDLRLELRSFVDCHRASDDWSRNTASTSESLLGANEDIWNVLVLAEKWQMQQNLQRFGICCHHNEFAETTIQRLGCLVCTTSNLLVVDRLLNQIHDFGGECRISEWVSFRVDFFCL